MWPRKRQGDDVKDFQIVYKILEQKCRVVLSTHSYDHITMVTLVTFDHIVYVGLTATT